MHFVRNPIRSDRYIIISPVKDEAAYVERTIKSVVGQTVKPYRWVVVDDASRDVTPQILSRYAEQHAWITVLTLTHNNERTPGSAVIRAFLAGYKLIEDEEFDYLVKLDCDLELPANYFESLLARFKTDTKLGIASGIYLEECQAVWNPAKMPEYHAAGCSKVLRAQCFRDIAGFVPQRGWDTVDEVRAQAMGWRTRHFEDLAMRHLKSEGVGIGFVRTGLMHGEIYYVTGGGALFLFLKFLHRLVFGRPIVLGGIMMLIGFLRASFKGQPKLVTSAEARLYRNLLNQRIVKMVTRALARLRLGRKVLGYS